MTARYPISDVAVEAAQPHDGVLLAPVGGDGTWTALRDIHEAMSSLRQRGHAPELSFVYAIARDGRIVEGSDPDAVTFAAGYRLGGR